MKLGLVSVTTIFLLLEVSEAFYVIDVVRTQAKKLPVTSCALFNLKGNEKQTQMFALTKGQNEVNDQDTPLISAHALVNSSSTITIQTDQNIVSSSLGKQAKSRKLRGAQVVEHFLQQPWVELAEALLVVASTFLVAVDTLSHLDPIIYSFIGMAGDAVAYFFCSLFVLRWYANAEQGPRYFTNAFVLVDIVVVILPLVLPFLNTGQFLPAWLTSKGGLINLRLLRILRLQRVLTDMDTFANFQRALGVVNPRDVKPFQLQLARVVLSLFTLLSVATGLIYTTEHVVNPNMPDYFTALYFGLTTLTTVGFGDITPVTTGGKLVVSGSILAGVAIIPAQAAQLFEAVLDYERQRVYEEQQTQQDKKTKKVDIATPSRGLIDTVSPCKSCGSTMHWVEAVYCWSCGSKL